MIMQFVYCCNCRMESIYLFLILFLNKLMYYTSLRINTIRHYVYTQYKMDKKTWFLAKFSCLQKNQWHHWHAPARKCELADTDGDEKVAGWIPAVWLRNIFSEFTIKLEWMANNLLLNCQAANQCNIYIYQFIKRYTDISRLLI